MKIFPVRVPDKIPRPEKHLPDKPEILDVGCGKGVQTLDLARTSKGKIKAVDNHAFFLDYLELTAQKEGYENTITCTNADMKSMPFKNECFDLIWSEGAVFIIGIKEGLKEWKKYLKKNGFLVLTDLIWLKNKRPEELNNYWEQEGLSIMTVEQVIAISDKEGYKLMKHFTLPASSWLKEYIMPQEAVIALLKAKYSSVNEALETYSAIKSENEIVKKYLGNFGYEFFIWRYTA